MPSMDEAQFRWTEPGLYAGKSPSPELFLKNLCAFSQNKIMKYLVIVNVFYILD